MKNITYLATGMLLGLLAGCQAVPPADQAAIILGSDVAQCACCGGWFVQIDSMRYRSDEVPSAFQKPNAPVWLRYKTVHTGVCGQAQGRISITDIRAR